MSTATKTSLKSELAPFQTLLLLFHLVQFDKFLPIFMDSTSKGLYFCIKVSKKKETFPENLQLGSFMS